MLGFLNPLLYSHLPDDLLHKIHTTLVCLILFGLLVFHGTAQTLQGCATKTLISSVRKVPYGMIGCAMKGVQYRDPRLQ